MEWFIKVMVIGLVFTLLVNVAVSPVEDWARGKMQHSLFLHQLMIASDFISFFYGNGCLSYKNYVTYYYVRFVKKKQCCVVLGCVSRVISE